jgi:hypothetical protein
MILSLFCLKFSRRGIVVKNCVCVACSFAVLALFHAGTSQAAIDRGSIRGTVSDAQGAAVPKVRVELVNLETGVIVNTITNETGFYAALELVPGKYSGR